MSAQMIEALRERSRQLRGSADSLRGTHATAVAFDGDICATCHGPVTSLGEGFDATWHHASPEAGDHPARPLDYGALLIKAEMHEWLADEFQTLANIAQGPMPGEVRQITVHDHASEVTHPAGDSTDAG